MNQFQPRPELELSASCYTPFRVEDGHLNEAALRYQLNRFVDAQFSSVWLVSSGTAEGNVLTPEEVIRVVDIAVEEVGGRIKVNAMGSEPRSALDNVAFAKRMFDRGVDAVQIGPVEPGHSYLPNSTELQTFYEQVLEEVTGPSYLATHVSVGYEVPPEILVDAARSYEQVVGLNVTHFRNFNYTPRILSLAEGVVPVFVSSPINAIEGLLLGASGISSSFDMNIAPWLYTEFAEAWATSDFTAIGATYTRISALFRAVLAAGGLIVAKAIMDRLGLNAGPPRAPRRLPDQNVMAQADEIITRFDLHA